MGCCGSSTKTPATDAAGKPVRPKPAVSQETPAKPKQVEVESETKEKETPKSNRRGSISPGKPENNAPSPEEEPEPLAALLARVETQLIEADEQHEKERDLERAR